MRTGLERTRRRFSLWISRCVVGDSRGAGSVELDREFLLRENDFLRERRESERRRYGGLLEKCVRTDGGLEQLIEELPLIEAERLRRESYGRRICPR
jgi:hypothetical protein